MADRPYTVLSCCMSIDGYLSGPSDVRLLLSNPDDLDRVDEVRSTCDAILVGARTVRVDNPRLLLRDPARRARRVARGLAPSPAKVTVTAGAHLDPAAGFFTSGDGEKLVYCASPSLGKARGRFGSLATVIDGGSAVNMCRLSHDLHDRGIGRLLVEGGASIHTQFLTADLADELDVAVAPFFVGDSRARHFVGDGRFPWHPGHRATLAEVRQVGDVALMRYALSDRFETSTERIPVNSLGARFA
ncbi:RibD family protein [Nakamurella panacisegetis]|uniref:RibD family protein n=1 Tax=Nakamurella panacisegetis TaxID=1090615 RepID=UPI000B87709D